MSKPSCYRKAPLCPNCGKHLAVINMTQRGCPNCGNIEDIPEDQLEEIIERMMNLEIPLDFDVSNEIPNQKKNI